jgi:DNA-binding NarL/FixJ family response regulator
MDQLTPREDQVAMLVARGLSNKEVAHELGVCGGTVKLHIHNILQKLGVRNRYGIIAGHVPLAWPRHDPPENSVRAPRRR